MMRLNLVLLLAVMSSALFLVRTQYDSRALYVQIYRAQAEARKLDVEHEQLQVDRQAQATSSRVQTLAAQKLQMRLASPGITQYVSDGQATYGAPAQGEVSAP